MPSTALSLHPACRVVRTPTSCVDIVPQPPHACSVCTFWPDLPALGSVSSAASQDFRKHLIGLTDVTHTSFDKLVAQLERGFEDMDT